MGSSALTELTDHLSHTIWVHCWAPPVGAGPPADVFVVTVTAHEATVVPLESLSLVSSKPFIIPLSKT